MTGIGILGAGVGANLAGRLSAAGHRVTLGVRNPDGTAALAAGIAPRIAFADQRTTAGTADVVINTTPGDSSLRSCEAAGRRHGQPQATSAPLIDIDHASYARGDWRSRRQATPFPCAEPATCITDRGLGRRMGSGRTCDEHGAGIRRCGRSAEHGSAVRVVET
ncbi:NAD(P)-binding domain-containing protein [Kitasatospora sp. NPDC004240]